MSVLDWFRKTEKQPVICGLCRGLVGEDGGEIIYDTPDENGSLVRNTMKVCKVCGDALDSVSV